MGNIDKSPATPESVWAFLQKSNRILTEKQAETDRLFRESKAETDRLYKENAREIADTTRQIKELKEMIGGMGNSNGMFAEVFFINTINNSDKKLFGEQDVLLVNRNSVAIKYRAKREDVEKLMERPSKFKVLYPQYQSHRIYLGLAAMSFDKGVEEETLKNGIAVIKQDGDMAVISDEQLKVF